MSELSIKLPTISTTAPFRATEGTHSKNLSLSVDSKRLAGAHTPVAWPINISRWPSAKLRVAPIEKSSRGIHGQQSTTINSALKKGIGSRPVEEGAEKLSSRKRASPHFRWLLKPLERTVARRHLARTFPPRHTLFVPSRRAASDIRKRQNPRHVTVDEAQF